MRTALATAADASRRLLRSILDVDSTSKAGQVAGDPLGEASCTVGQLVASRGGSLTLPLSGTGAKKGSTLTVTSEEMAVCKGQAVLGLKGVKLANRDGWFGKSDPFWVLSKMTETGAFVQVAKSAVIMNNLNPIWQPVKCAVQRMCNGDMHRPLRLDVMDWDKDDKFEAIGHADTDAATLLTPGAQIALKHPRGKPKPVGTIVVASAQVLAEPSFMDYLAGGMEISLLVGIDLTASNGEPYDPRSLHFRGGGTPNPYQVALSAVGSVLAPYDHDGRIPAYGYGAALPPSNVVSHCFALSGSANDPACDGVAGVLRAYDTALSSVRLSGPTCFAPLITAAATAAEAASKGPGLSYHVLLIITDGEIMDMDATVNALVRASRTPLSLVIVGVGDADFTAMNALDCDNGLLRGSSAGVAARDIVQFVQMRDYTGRSSGARLAREVLAEIPQQVVGHFMARGIPPPPPQRLPPRDSTRF